MTPRSSKRPRVLVVEDEQPLRELVVVTLGEAYDCEEAADGDTALERLRAQAPDLVVLDAMIPGRSGLDVLREMRAHPKLKKVPVVGGSSITVCDRTAYGDAAWGEDDTIIPVDHAYAALEARPDCRLEVLPDVGHFAHVEAPTQVVDLIDDFIKTTSARVSQGI